MIRFEKLPHDEQIRCRWCRGCVYLGTLDSCGCCNYFIIEDRLRGTPFGEKCPVKHLAAGYVLPDGYEQECEWEDERLRKAIERNRKKFVRNAAKDGKRGRKMTWDADYAQQLYNKGYYLVEIAEVLDVSLKKVEATCNNRNWYYQAVFHNVKIPARHRHNIQKAKAEYAAYLAAKKQETP